MGKMTLTFGKKMELYERMKEVCKKDGENAVYQEGWSDNRLARMLGVTQPIIRGIREEMFGKTIRGPKEKPAPLLTQALTRLDALERRMANLETNLGITS